MSSARQKSDQMEAILVRKQLRDLKRHPALAEAGIVSPVILMQDRDVLLANEPITITPDGWIIGNEEGYEYAKQHSYATVLCVVLPLSKADSLKVLIEKRQKHNPLSRLNRIALAILLENHLRKTLIDASKANASSNLTKEPVDVRKELAAIAMVSAGNFSAGRYILENGCAKLCEEVRANLRSIHSGCKIARIGSKAEQEKYLKMEKEIRSTPDLVDRSVKAANPRFVALLKRTILLKKSLLELSSEAEMSDIATEVAVFLEVLSKKITNIPEI
jgi:hypothetical protein